MRAVDSKNLKRLFVNTSNPAGNFRNLAIPRYKKRVHVLRKFCLTNGKFFKFAKADPFVFGGVNSGCKDEANERCADKDCCDTVYEKGKAIE
jgi:hypothetical protein